MPYHWMKQGTKEAFASNVVFLLPALALTSSFGMTLMQAVILVATIWAANKGLPAWFAENLRTIRWIAAGFAGYFIVAIVRMPFSSSGLSSLDGPFRFLVALSCIGFIGWFRPNIRHFWLGLCAGAIGAGVVAIAERTVYGIDHRVMGFTHHPITFGNLSLALGLMSLCAWSELRNTRWFFLPGVAVLASLVASILSGSRGGWLALGICVVLIMYYGRRIYGSHVRYVALLVPIVFAIAYFIPGTTIDTRIDNIFSDIEAYFWGGDASTSLGIRFELWKGSFLMFLDHPVFGVGRGNFQAAMDGLVQQGRIQPSVAVEFWHSHNDFLYFLASGGILELAFLLLFYGAPLCIFVSVLHGRRSGDPALALAGLLLVTSFIGFGLTEAMFWLMATKVFYLTMVCSLVGFCLIAGKRDTALSKPAEKTESELQIS